MSTLLLELRDLQVRYGRHEALRGVALEVREGEMVGLLGSNGAGKSSLLAAVAGLCQDTGGQVLYEDRDVLGRPVEDLFLAGVVLVPQGRGLFRTLSVRDNLALALDARRIPALQRRAALDEVRFLFPGLDAQMDRIASDLPAQEQLWLALTRALLCRPRLLMVDEPSQGLEPENVQQLFEWLTRIHAEGTSVLLAEQNARQALRICDRAYVLEGGRVSLSGAAQDLLRDPRMVAAYLDG